MKKLLVVVSVVMALPVMSLACGSASDAVAAVDQALQGGSKASYVTHSDESITSNAVIRTFLIDGGNGAQYEVSYNVQNDFDGVSCNFNSVTKAQ